MPITSDLLSELLFLCVCVCACVQLLSMVDRWASHGWMPEGEARMVREVRHTHTHTHTQNISYSIAKSAV